VWRSELLDSQNSLASLGKMVHGSAAHRAEAKNNHVEMHSVQSWQSEYGSFDPRLDHSLAGLGPMLTLDLESQLDVFRDAPSLDRYRDVACELPPISLLDWR
jgi:hypothetical protein